MVSSSPQLNVVSQISSSSANVTSIPPALPPPINPHNEKGISNSGALQGALSASASSLEYLEVSEPQKNDQKEFVKHSNNGADLVPYSSGTPRAKQGDRLLFDEMKKIAEQMPFWVVPQLPSFLPNPIKPDFPSLLSFGAGTANPASTSAPLPQLSLPCISKMPIWEKQPYPADSDPILAVTREIEDYANFISELTKTNFGKCEKMIQRISQATKRLWPNSEVVSFGSFATNLCIPSSDIDLVCLVRDPNETRRSALRSLARLLRQQSWVASLRPIETASMPVIKLISREEGISTDITFGETSPDNYVADPPMAQEYWDAQSQSTWFASSAIHRGPQVTAALKDYIRFNRKFIDNIF